MASRPRDRDECIRCYSIWLEAGDFSAGARAAGYDSRMTFKRYVQEAQAQRYVDDSIIPGFEIVQRSETFDKHGELVRRSDKQKPEAGGKFNVPEGHTIKGVSTLVDGEGQVRSQWYKTTNQPDPMALAESVRSIFEGLTPADEVPAPLYSDSDLLTVYPIADAHIGMMAWGRETGESYDVNIATNRLRSWVGSLVASSPPSSEAVILDVGDTTHMDDGTNQTPASKHILDVDGRIYRTLEMTIEAMADSVELALAKHSHVHFVIIPGNHNPHSYPRCLCCHPCIHCQIAATCDYAASESGRDSAAICVCLFFRVRRELSRCDSHLILPITYPLVGSIRSIEGLSPHW